MTIRRSIILILGSLFIIGGLIIAYDSSRGGGDIAGRIASAYVFNIIFFSFLVGAAIGVAVLLLAWIRKRRGHDVSKFLKWGTYSAILVILFGFFLYGLIINIAFELYSWQTGRQAAATIRLVEFSDEPILMEGGKYGGIRSKMALENTSDTFLEDVYVIIEFQGDSPFLSFHAGKGSHVSIEPHRTVDLAFDHVVAVGTEYGGNYAIQSWLQFQENGTPKQFKFEIEMSLNRPDKGGYSIGYEKPNNPFGINLVDKRLISRSYAPNDFFIPAGCSIRNEDGICPPKCREDEDIDCCFNSERGPGVWQEIQWSYGLQVECGRSRTCPEGTQCLIRLPRGG